MLSKNYQKGYQRGETVIGVLIAFTVFSMVAVLSMRTMNSSIAVAQTSLEVTLARNEIDAQAEALRFIHNAFIGERNLHPSDHQFTAHWNYIVNHVAIANHEAAARLSFDAISCNDVYETSNHFLRQNNAFVVNTRGLAPSNHEGDIAESMIIVADHFNHRYRFRPAPLSPRIIFGATQDGAHNTADHIFERAVSSDLFRAVQAVEGIYIIAVAGPPHPLHFHEPEFHDFYIRTCWRSPGNPVPSTIGTIIRFYNAEVMD